MAYSDVVDMARSQSLLQRIAACAAEQGADDPNGWAMSNAWKVVSAPGWADSWASAKASYSSDQNPDTGARGDVITDGAILAVVQPLVVAG